MAALTTYGKGLVLAWLLTTGTAARPTTWYVALHTGDPGAAAANNEVTTGMDASYVRKAVTFAAPGSGQDQSSTDVSWTVNSGSAGYTVTYASIWDSSTGGNSLLYAPLFAIRALVASGVLTFSAGDIVAAAS